MKTTLTEAKHGYIVDQIILKVAEGMRKGITNQWAEKIEKGIFEGEPGYFVDWRKGRGQMPNCFVPMGNIARIVLKKQ